MKNIFNSRAAGFSASQASVLAMGFAVTLGLGITGGAVLIGQLAPLFLCQQVATGVLQQSLGDAGLYLKSNINAHPGHKSRTKRNVAFLAALGALATAAVGALLALTLGTDEIMALLLLTASVFMIVIAEILRLVLIWEGKLRQAWAGSIGQVLIAFTAFILAAATHNLDVFSMTLAAGTALLVGYELLAARTVPLPSHLRSWMADKGPTMKAAALDSAWGTAGLAVAQQLTGLLAGAAVLGEVRVGFQVLSVMVFLGVVTRRTLISSDRSITKVGLKIYLFFPVAALLLALGAWLIGALVPALAFIPRLGVLLAAAAERTLTAIQQVESGRLMKLGHTSKMLSIRRTGSIIVAAALPASAFFFGAAGFFAAGALIGIFRMIAYKRIR